MLTRKQKEELVKELADKINRQQSLIFTFNFYRYYWD